MDTLLEWLTGKTLLAAGALLAALWLGDRYQEYPRRWWQDWRHPPVGKAAGGADIRQDLERSESERFQGRYKRLCEQIAAARAKGLAVDGLQRAADSLLAFDRPGYRAEALERLNKLSLAVPQESEHVRPAGLEEGAAAAQPPPRHAPVKTRRRKRARPLAR